MGIVIDNRGLVPDADVKRLREFGAEIEAGFKQPVAQTSGKGNQLELDTEPHQVLTYIVIQEDISKGENIRKYELLGKTNGNWTIISRGECVGHKRIEKVKGSYEAVKLIVTENWGPVTIKNLACY